MVKQVHKGEKNSWLGNGEFTITSISSILMPYKSKLKNKL